MLISRLHRAYLARCGHRNGGGLAQMLDGCAGSETFANHQLWLALKRSELEQEHESEYGNPNYIYMLTLKA